MKLDLYQGVEEAKKRFFKPSLRRLSAKMGTQIQHLQYLILRQRFRAARAGCF